MLKIDRIKTFLNCDQCHELLVDPVTIPCGYSVCKRHLEELLEGTANETNSIACKLCQEEHPVPPKGFIVSKRLQEGLQMQLNTLEID